MGQQQDARTLREIAAAPKAKALTRGQPEWKERAQRVFADTMDAVTGFVGLPLNDSRASTLGELVAS